MANVNRQWVLAKRPHGNVSKANFEYREGRIPKPKDGQLLVRNLYLSFDPTQRGWMEDRPSYLPPVKIGEVMRASSVGEVVRVESSGLRAGRQGDDRRRLAGLLRRIADAARRSA